MTPLPATAETPGPGSRQGQRKGADTIVCRELAKIYETRDGHNVLALASINLTIKDGEFLTVVGPSGCGKSTLLKVLGGLTDITRGEALLNGSPIVGPRRDIGVVFQSPTLLPWRTVLDNVMLPIHVLGLDRTEGEARARGLIEMVGLAGFEMKYPNELSGGMQQRVAISRALVHQPALLLMDEPFGALDALTREAMNTELQRIWMETRRTIFLITHSITEAVFLGDRVAVMTPRPGKLAEHIDVDLPRPRSLDIMTSPRFGELVTRIRGLLQTQGGLE
jgi:NitT/TauT family transport system ATP-binding protein